MTTPLETTPLLAAALSAAGDVAYDWDLATDALAWSDGARELFRTADLAGLSQGAGFTARISPQDLPDREAALAEHYRTRTAFDCEYRLRQADGLVCWVHDRGAAVFAPDGRPVRLRGVLRQVTDRKQREARLERRANYDELTGHLNASRLREALHQALITTERYGGAGAYLCIGIDKLSVISNGIGYAAADAVIIAAGHRLERVLRNTDLMGRIGGGVYGVILSHCPEAEIARVAERILQAFRAGPIDTPAGPIHASVSIGGIGFPSAVRTASEAMTHGEAAMREAKRAGRDGFVLYRQTEEERQSQRNAMVVGEQIKEALRDDRLVLAFQPVVDAGERRVRFYECLARLRLPGGRILPAGAFVPVAEQLGLSRPLDRRVLELAVTELAASPEVRFSFNISGFTAVDQSWLRLLVALVGRRPDIARRMIVEITETAAIQDIAETARFVTTVRDLGCQVALDDFGAGFTTFRHLKALTIDVVKIDGFFVRDIAARPENRLFVQTLVSLAKGFGLSTVAEYVETAEDAAVLTGEGIDYLQGYYFAKPSLDRLWLQPGGGVVMPHHPPLPSGLAPSADSPVPVPTPPLAVAGRV